MRGLGYITQKYTDYTKPHDLRIYAILRSLRSLRSLRRNLDFYADFTQHYAAKLHYASYSWGGGKPPPHECCVMLRNDA